MICRKCGRGYDPPYVALSPNDPIRRLMTSLSQCWWCCRGLVLRSGTPPAAQPDPGPPSSVVPRGHDGSTESETGPGGGTP